LARYARRAITGHVLICVGSFLLFLLLNRPEIILLSKLGMTAWYPATGLAFALMLGISPRYMPLLTIANGLAGVLIYDQPFFAWDTLVGASLETGAYALAAYLLRGPIKIDWTLSQRRDVLKYVLLTSLAAISSALVGAACLWADHTIPLNQFWSAWLIWLCGDAISLFSVGPFLLIHVLPKVNKWIAPPAETSAEPLDHPQAHASGISLSGVMEVLMYAACFTLLFWFMFGPLLSRRIDYLVFLPVVWIAMRYGIRGIVTGLLFLNFGIVLSLQVVPPTPELFTKLEFLMLAFSGTGLIVGSEVTERQGIAKELKENTIFLKSLIGNSPFGIVVQDAKAGITLVNDAFLDLFHYGAVEVVGKNLNKLIVPADQQSNHREMMLKVASGRSVHETVTRVGKGGCSVDAELHAMPVFKNGKVQGGFAIYKDISEQVKAARAAREYEESMNYWVSELQQRTMQITLLNEMAGLLQCAETSGEAYTVVSQSARKLFAGIRSGSLFIFNSPLNSLEAKATWGQNCDNANPFPPSDCWSLRINRPHWSECPSQGMVCTHVDNSAATNYLCVPMVAQGETLGVFHIQCEPDGYSGDMEADQKRRESQQRLAVAAASEIGLSLANLRLREALREQSIRDPLTALFNRRFMQESLEKELVRARRKDRSLAIVFLDLDHFKRFNDNFGHDAGDSVLRTVADALRSNFRGEDVICRYGGEEFAVILPETSIKDAFRRAEALREAVRDLKLSYRGLPLDPITLSIGVVAFPNHGRDARELLEQADKCLYQSKTKGRDRVTLAAPEKPALIPG
jgi:diguanylate cyclase (GGDEF)-like protein/PAS domain S-box-containing protein